MAVRESPLQGTLTAASTPCPAHRATHAARNHQNTPQRRRSPPVFTGGLPVRKGNANYAPIVIVNVWVLVMVAGTVVVYVIVKTTVPVAATASVSVMT